jgi:hypothetical protein
MSHTVISKALKKAHDTLMADPRVDMPKAPKPGGLKKASKKYNRQLRQAAL